MSLLYAKNLKMLPKTDIVLPYKQQNISAMQHKGRYNMIYTCVAMEDNAAQHWWYSTIILATNNFKHW